MTKIPFGRRLGRRYPCPSCDKTFLLEDHNQTVCSTKCARIAKNKARSDAKYARLYPEATVTANAPKNAHSIRIPPAAFGTPGWEERCRYEWALSQKAARIDASTQSRADREELARYRESWSSK